MAVKFGMTVLEIIGQLTRGFMKAMGRKPDGLEKIKIQQEAVQRFKDMNKVVDMEGNVLDPSKPIMGGTQEGAALKSGIMKATGAKPMSVKTKNRPDVYDLDDYDTTNMSDIKKEIIRTETKLGNLNPESEGFREKAKELVDKIEALKNKMRDDKATGGRIGYKIGSLDKARREFLKKAAGVGGGIAALKAGLLGLSKKAPEAVETVKETVKQAPDYFFALVDKIRRLGTMVDDAVADPRMERTYRYKNYELRENAYGTPDETVVTKIDDRGEFGYKEESMVYKKGGMTEEGRMADEYEEYTIRPDEDGKLKDIDTGIDDVSDIIREATDEAPSIKKAGGGLAYMLGV